ncbi:MAG: DUF3256 family protein [Bacteroidaceae bacterium]|nr:DUF3256 family protein [Bacteroidaceae bacterium]
MKRIVSILMLFACCALQDAAAQDMRSLFLNATDDVFPLLTWNNRADCVDYVDAGMEARVTNLLGGTSVLKRLTGEYLYLETSANSWVEARLLPSAEDTIICMVKGVKAEATDSRLFFYDRSWRALSCDSLVEEPAIDEFFASADSAAVYSARCDIYLVRYSLDSEDALLTAEYTMPAYMNNDDAAKVAPLLRVISYRWNGKRFVRE